MFESAVETYRLLISSFLDRRISASQFEEQFLAAFKSESAPLSEAVFIILDKLFAEVDAFCPDTGLRDDDDIDEDGLRARCAEAMAQLDEWARSHGGAT